MPETENSHQTESTPHATPQTAMPPVGSVVDPAEVVPPVVPAQRTYRSWLKPLALILLLLIVATLIVVNI
jgi:hypothetical protein